MKKLSLYLILITLLSFTNVNAQWVEIEASISQDIEEVVYQDKVLFASTRDNLWFSRDEGNSWDTVYIKGNPKDSLIFENLIIETLEQFNDGLFLVGRNKVNNNGAVFRLRGLWELMYEDSLNRGIHTISMSGGSGIVGGSEGLLLYTIDAGDSWQDISSGQIDSVNSVQRISFTEAIVSTPEGIYRTNGSYLSGKWHKIYGSHDFLDGNYIIDGNFVNFFSSTNGFLLESVFVGSDTTEVLGVSPPYILTKEGTYEFNPGLGQNVSLLYSSTAAGYDLNDIVKVGDSNLVGVGNNGLIIKSLYSGEFVDPVASFYFGKGDCEEELVSIKNLSSYYKFYDYYWTLDGIKFSQEFEPVVSFYSPGSYEVSLFVKSHQVEDPVFFTQTITISEKDLSPIIKVDNGTLCNSGEASVNVINSSLEKNYFLCKSPYYNNPSSIIDRAVGNGSLITLMTGEVMVSTDYYFVVEDIISGCSNIVDTVSIVVEQPLAGFKTSHINLPIRDSLTILNQSLDATNYYWSLGNDATTSSDLSSDTITVNYSTEGIKDIWLFASTDLGCTDSTNYQVYVYNPGDEGSTCWAMVTEGTYIHKGSTGLKLAHDIKADDAGNVYSAGVLADYSIPSMTGQGFRYDSLEGAYLSKHDASGVLTWVLTSDGGAINLVEPAGEGSLYVIGRDLNGANFYVNGSKISLIDVPVYRHDGSLLKLNEAGDVLWAIHPQNVRIEDIALDVNLEHFYVKGNYHHESVFRDVNGDFGAGTADYRGEGFLAKYNSDGEHQWIKYEFDSEAITTDPYGNVINVRTNNNVLILEAYNSDGGLNWQSEISSSLPSENQVDVETDDQGNIYLTGLWFRNGFEKITDALSNRFTADSLRGSVIVSFSPSGRFRWAQGSLTSSIVSIASNHIEVSGTEVYLGGMISIDSLEVISFTSADESTHKFSIDARDIFIANYSTAGTFKFASLGPGNGFETGNKLSLAEVKNFDIDPDGNIVLTGNIFPVNGQPAVIAGDTLIINSHAPMVAKYSSDVCYNKVDIDSIAPEAPYVLTVDSVSAYDIHLSWDAVEDSGSGLAGYLIYRDDVDGPINGLISLETAYVDESAKCDSIYSYTIRAIDLSGNISLESNSAVAENDQCYLSIPQNLRTINIERDQVSLAWDNAIAADAGAIVSYNLYRNSESAPLNPSPTDTPFYIDSTLWCGKSYNYYVKAVDQLNIESEASAILNVSTLACIDSVPPFATYIQSVSQGQDTSLVIKWSDGTDYESGVLGYNIYRDTIRLPLNLTPISGISYTDTTTRCSTTYKYFITVVDNQGNESGKSSGKSSQTRYCFGYKPPLVPWNLHIDQLGQSSIRLDWSNSYDPGSANVVGYNVFLNGNTQPINDWGVGRGWDDSEFVLLDIKCDSSYSFTVSTYDMWGNESDVSEAVVYDQECPELIPPSVPLNLRVASYTHEEVVLEWDASIDTGNSGLSGYNIYKNGIPLPINGDVVNTTYFVDDNIVCDKRVQYSVTSIDNDFNESEYSDQISVRPKCQDFTAPTVPTGFRVQSFDSSVNILTWNPSEDIGSSGLAGYYLYRSSRTPFTTLITDTVYYDSVSVNCNQTLYYGVIAADSSNNKSGRANYTFTTLPCPDITPPTTPGNITATITDSSITLEWTGSSAGDSGLAGYLVSRDGELISDTLDAITFIDNSIACENTYFYEVVAIDKEGNRSTPADIEAVVGNCPDFTAPSTPSDFTAKISEDSLVLNWAVSTDSGTGLFGYVVSRDGMVISDTLVTSSFTDNTITCENTYTYEVIALDNAGNESSPVTVEVTAPTCTDIEAPSVPGELTAILSDSGVKISWTASTDDGVGLAGYWIYRDDTLLSDLVSDTFYFDNKIQCGRIYTYTLLAFDSIGNSSLLSEPISVESNDCLLTGIDSNFSNEINIFPNPTDKFFIVSSDQLIISIKAIDLNGNIIKVINEPGNRVQVVIEEISAQTIVLLIELENGMLLTKKLITK